MAKLSINGQISEMDWTIDQMRKWFDHRINARLLKKSEAELHTEQQLAILETLNWFADQEPYIRRCFRHRAYITTMLDKMENIDAEDATGVDRGD